VALASVEAPHEIEAIVGGYHGDPFRILGPHAVRKEDHPAATAYDVWEIRAFLPHAATAEVLIGGRRLPMEKQHSQGFFVATLDYSPEAYRLRLHLWNGGIEEIDDPYRFPPILTEFELYLHGEGTHFESYNTLGAHLCTSLGVAGTCFSVWAPNAEVMTLVGEFNHWDTRRHPMRLRSGGIWEFFMPEIGEGAHYKYYVRSKFFGHRQLKSDPYGFAMEVPPKSASIVADLSTYEWHDQQWLERRGATDWLKQPMSVYEIHLESWLRGPKGELLTYRELAESIVKYVKEMGYTHIELLPVMEHPFSGSWGYQVIGYYAPTSRFGGPREFMYFVDLCHQNGIGVIVDWVPAHFPKDAHGLAWFDGTALYEHADPRKGEHRDWGTLIFNYGRNEVRTFLISNALFWLKKYHIDGLRVDAVASMLYLDYSREAGEWIPNMYGGNENLEAISLLRKFNELAHQVQGAVTMAEESTAFPGVSKPVYLNGLGFTMKWNMGWMHDMLNYFSQDPVHRKYHHNNITFSFLYAFTENFVLPISHDEVVHGKGSLLQKMPGDEWQQFASVRAFLGYMYTHPGKKLLFMGSEFGVREEWNYNSSMPWHLLTFDPHRHLQNYMRALNRLYSSEPALYEVDFHYSGFEWVDFHDAEGSVIAFIRRGESSRSWVFVACNFTPVVRQGYRLGVPEEGFYEELLNSDASAYGGGNVGNGGMISTDPIPSHGRPHSLSLTLPPLAVVVLRKR
jgi:1,4-alpha-glucan branching enzyme